MKLFYFMLSFIVFAFAAWLFFQDFEAHEILMMVMIGVGVCGMAKAVLFSNDY